jgi:DNA polymerase V
MRLKDKTFALVDCNNFYVSCERVWDPKLRNVPVVVWSNNDSCAISRSQEAKDAGITMGMPAFKARDVLKKFGIHGLSSNYALYADMSRRSVNVLSTFTPNIEPYSIDESFLDLDGIPLQKLGNYGKEIKKAMQKNVGLPVGVGIASTKTLSKIANHLAKKRAVYGGVCDLKSKTEQELNELLATFPVGDIWGIGWRNRDWLMDSGIDTALKLKQADPKWIRKKMTVMGERIVLELNGISCMSIRLFPEAKKGIASTRQFGRDVTDFEELCESITWHCTKACEKLRSQGSLASVIFVFIKTNRHSKNKEQYSRSISINLPEHSDYTPQFVRYALSGLRQIFQRGYNYHKAGIILTGIIDKASAPYSIFEEQNIIDQRQKRTGVMTAIDRINKRWGNNTLFLARQGVSQSWHARQMNKSQRFTTHWKELPTAKL